MVRGVWPLNWLRNGCPGRIAFPTPCEAEGVGELRVVVELEVNLTLPFACVRTPREVGQNRRYDLRFLKPVFPCSTHFLF